MTITWDDILNLDTQTEPRNGPCLVPLTCPDGCGLEHALEDDERFAVWGGMKPRERDRLRRPGRQARPDDGHDRPLNLL